MSILLNFPAGVPFRWLFEVRYSGSALSRSAELLCVEPGLGSATVPVPPS